MYIYIAIISAFISGFCAGRLYMKLKLRPLFKNINEEFDKLLKTQCKCAGKCPSKAKPEDMVYGKEE